MLKLIICALFLLTVSCENWQGIGNFTDSNLTDIKSILGGQLSNILGMNGPMNGMAKNISTQLNSKWDPAWNVLVTKQADRTHDGIVYGYAFNDHWLWYNNYLNTSISIIIWKDYNC